MQRRFLLAASGSALLLGACGFQLRAAPELAFQSLYVGASENSSLGNELRRNLASLGNLQVITDPKLQPTAQAVLDILLDQREKTVVGVNASGQVREFQLRVRVRFRLRTPQGRELIPETELLLQRDISFNESAVLAKEAEEGLMYRDMQSDIVQQLIHRLAAVRTL
ncbi:MAG: LPS assembly lipoprotein LptE [Burkholderiaceae bacterium]